MECAAVSGTTEAQTQEVRDIQEGPEHAIDTLHEPNLLLKGLVPTTKTYDRHVSALVRKPEANHYFNQWKCNMNSKSTVKRIRMTLDELLPRLIGARDYAGASKVLEVIYHQFTLNPALCIEASLEILRRQQDYYIDLLSFYKAALGVERIDKLLILKEMWLLHIVHGEFYEAYHLYEDKIQQIEEAENDARLLANFGILSYWLMLIESKELRNMLKLDNTDCEVDDGEDDFLSSGIYLDENIESMIESNYQFKTPIGVHILYQHASNALRRAVALCPNSAMFVEYYVQLLLLVGDIQPACDYIENFYHMNSDDPHGPRMLARFLAVYYPDSVDAQIVVLSRWMKNDPSSSYPLEKILELSSAGVVSSFVLTKVLVDALDTCGSDLYVMMNPNIAMTLWRNLAELVTALDEDEFLRDQLESEATGVSNQVTLLELGAQHLWWKRVYLARPNTVQEIVAITNQNSDLMKVYIYRAAVAQRLFSDTPPIAEALFSAMQSSEVAFSHEHVRLYKSFFTVASLTTSEMVVPKSFRVMPFMSVVYNKNRQMNFLQPLDKGTLDFIHVMKRNSIIKTEAAGENSKVIVTQAGSTENVDPRLVEDLYSALSNEVMDTGTTESICNREPSANLFPLLTPAFVGIVEEEVYTDPDASLRHIYSRIYQKLRRSKLLVPTSKVVSCYVDFFRNRFKESLQGFVHSRMLLRYERFIVNFLRHQLALGALEITEDFIKVAADEMKRVLPSPHPHFPNEKAVEETMRLYVPKLLRQRRLQLIELKKTLQPVLKKLVYVDENLFVDAAYTVCCQSVYLFVLTRADIGKVLQRMMPVHYYGVLEKMRPSVIHLLTTHEFRGDCDTAEDILKKLKRNKPALQEIKALLWIERYEAMGGFGNRDEEKDGSRNDCGSGDKRECDSDASSSSKLHQQ